MPKRTVRGLEATFKGLSMIGQLKAELELLTHYSTDTVYRLRYDNMQYDYISPSIVRLLGYTNEELKVVNLRSLIMETRLVGEGMRAVESYLNLEENRKRGEVRKWQADYLMKTKDGRDIWVSDISYPWFDDRGAIIGSIGSLRDITERIEVEQKIREELTGIIPGDSLTGLASRQTFWSRLEDETKRLKRTHGDLGLLLIDVDQFHKVNEAYGQAVGDTVLTGIADLLSGCVRDIDLIARISGEEFGIILPETPADGAAKVAARMRDAVAHHTFFAGSNSNPLGCTISIGVASTRFGQSTDATALYKLADMRLYIAKHTGISQISTESITENLH